MSKDWEKAISVFRTRILHQAETGGESKVWSVGELIRDDGGRLTVYRTKFREQLKMDIEAYIAALQGDEEDRDDLGRHETLCTK